MKTANYNLKEIFANRINDLHNIETQYLHYFEELSGAASIKELNASLSPARSEQNNHVSRLEIIIDNIESTITPKSDTVSTAIITQLKKIAANKKKPGLIKDVQIMNIVKSVYAFKIASYSSLQLIAEALDLKPIALLLEQSLEDSRNNMAYLIQIERNIIYPKFRG